MNFYTWGMTLAIATAARSTCARASVGCVLFDKHKRVLATGYNGVPKGMPHCIEAPCEGANKLRAPDSCMATHAEINALIQCKEVMDIHYVICTHAPCFRCLKALLNTTMAVLVYKESIEPIDHLSIIPSTIVVLRGNYDSL